MSKKKMGRESVAPFAPLVVTIVEFQQTLGKETGLIEDREKIKGRYSWRPEKPEKARCMEGGINRKAKGKSDREGECHKRARMNHTHVSP
jgi:hypothetical protein